MAQNAEVVGHIPVVFEFRAAMTDTTDVGHGGMMGKAERMKTGWMWEVEALYRDSS